MSHYSKAIRTYSIIQPAFLAGLLIAIALGITIYMKMQLGKKEAPFGEYQQLIPQRNVTLQAVGSKKAETEQWESLLAKDAKIILEEQFNEASARASRPPLELISSSDASRLSPLANALPNQKARSYNRKYSGSYRDFQNLCIETEFRLPNLNLDKLVIEPAPNSSTSAIFEVTYSAWSK